MKITTIYYLSLWSLGLAALPSDLLAQDQSKYPIEISDIDLPSDRGEPQILLSAIAKDVDFYILTLRVSNNANFRLERIVNPFTKDKFISNLRIARKDLLSQYWIQEGRDGLEINEAKTTKRLPFQESIREPFDTLQTQYETSLFYQLKGSEISTPIGLGRPEAGRLYFSASVMVEKKLDAYNKQIFNAQIKSCIQEHLEKTSLNMNDRVKKNISRSLEKSCELDFIRKSNAEFNMTVRNYLENLQAKYEAGDEIDEEKSMADTIFERLYNKIRSDNTIEQRLRNRFLNESKQAYDYHLQPYLMVGKDDEDSYGRLYSIRNKNNTEIYNNDKELKEIDSLLRLDMETNLWEMGDFLYGNWLFWTTHLSFKEKAREIYKNLSDSLHNSLLPALARKPLFKFDISYVELEFNEGFIENILVLGNVKTLDISKFYDDENLGKIVYSQDINSALNEYGIVPKQIKFENKYPFGFSRKSDYESLNEVLLFSNGNEGEKYTLKLGDLLTIYLPKHEVGRRDFSPENRVVKYEPAKGNDFIILYKEETSKLFEARVYSDFVGLDAKAANGLLQTEIAKRLNLNTKRIFANSHRKFWRGWGGFSWLEPTIALSKIEQNNKNLLLTQVVPNDTFGRTRYYITTLDIKRHESLSVGARLNTFSYDIPGLKSTLSCNGALYYGRTPTQTDTMESGINTLTFSPEANCDVRADERWGLSFSWRWNFMRTMSRDVVQISDLLDPSNHLAKRIKNNLYNTTQFQVFFQPSEDNRGRLFFRYRYHWQYGDQNLGFHQAQVGYSFYLLGRNKGQKK